MQRATLLAIGYQLRADPTVDQEDIPRLLDRLKDQSNLQGQKKPELLRFSEATRTLNVSRWTLARWLKSGRLKAIQIGGVRRIRRSDLESLIAGV